MAAVSSHSTPAESAPISLSAHEDQHSSNQLDFRASTLIHFLDSVSSINFLLLPRGLDATRHLPIISEGSLFDVKEYIRGHAQQRDVVAKVCKRSLSPGSQNGFSKEEYAKLLKELRILCFPPVLRSEKLITIESGGFAILQAEPLDLGLVICLESAKYGNLSAFQKSEEGSQLSWDTRKSLCFDIASGLEILHEHGIVHGGLNPEHVLIFDHPDSTYSAKLTGFGDAVITTDNNSDPFHTTVFGGTGPLRAPEVEEGSVQPEWILKTDIFSLGLLLWNVLVNKDAFTVFDLPLDKTLRDEQLQQVLAMSYFYRFIPLLIEHELGLFEEEEFELLQELFKCTVRIAPRARDLGKVLQLLSPKGSVIHETPDRTADPRPAKTIPLHVPLAFQKIQASIAIIKELPFLAAKQYVASLKLLCANSDTSHELQSNASWLLFQCYLHGYGVKRDFDAALKLLEHNPDSEAGELHKPHFLYPIFVDIFMPEKDDSEASNVALISRKLNDMMRGGRGPWMQDDKHVTFKAIDHGIVASKSDVMSWFTARSDGTSFTLLQHQQEKLEFGNTLLHAAVAYGMVEAVHFLVKDARVNINATNDLNETALVLACMVGNADIAQCLLDQGADARIQSSNGQNGLHWLNQFERDRAGKIMMALVKRGANPGLRMKPSTRYDSEFAPLIRDQQKFLSDGSVGGGPLLQAVANRDIRTLGLLLSACELFIVSLDPQARLISLIENLIFQPLQLACDLLFGEIIDVICRYLCVLILDIPEAGIPSILKGDVEDLKTDSTALGAIFVKATGSNAPLRSAIELDFLVARYCYHGRQLDEAFEASVKTLARFGFLQAMVNTRRGPWHTLSFAVRCGNEKALELLMSLESYAKLIDEADNAGYTLVHHALETQQFGCLTILAERGATLDLRKKKDPRHVLSGVEASYIHVLGSLRVEDPRFINLLLDHGVPATICDNRNLSALNLALKRGAFVLARLLIQNGASISSHGIFGLTPLGELLLPGQADQHDDLFSTFNFLLSYEDKPGVSLFITNHDVGYSVLHTAAAYPPKQADEALYIKLIDKLVEHFHKPEQLTLKAKNPAKSSALLTAIAMNNPFIIKALVDAGVSVTETDEFGQTPLMYAQETYQRIWNMRTDILPEQKNHKLEQMTTIILKLAESSGWPAEFQHYPRLFQAWPQLEILLHEMTLSAHQVSYMRHLETAVLRTVYEGMSPMFEILSPDGSDRLRRVVERKVRPILRVDIEYWISSNGESQRYQDYLQESTKPRNRLENSKNKSPWWSTLADSRLEDFQHAAAFEWSLDCLQKKEASLAPRLQLVNGEFDDFIKDPNPEHLPFDPELIRFPMTLLQWYHSNINNDTFSPSKECEAQITGFVDELSRREEMRVKGVFPLPEFSPEFRKFHFNDLQKEDLETGNAFDSVRIVTRCRCYHDKIGLFAPFTMMRMCQRSTSIDERTWQTRLKIERKTQRKDTVRLSQWKARVGVDNGRTSFLSIMRRLWLAEQSPDIPSLRGKLDSLLTYPENVKQEEEKAQTPSNLATSSDKPSQAQKTELLTKFDYGPLDLGKSEIRLLTLLPPKAEVDLTNDTIECSIGTYNLDLPSPEFANYLSTTNTDETSPNEFYKGWHQHLTAIYGQEKTPQARFEWGEFSCLSYTWGSSSDVARILLNGVEITVGANLEAALRVLRMQENFAAGMMLWVDQLCINQSDLGEKEVVVRNMSIIYSMADTVTVWLGPGEQDSKYYTDIIHEFVSKYASPDDDGTPQTHKDKNVPRPPPFYFATKVYPAVKHIMDRTYWRRLWIMQEITAGAPVENIFLGSNRISQRELRILLRSQSHAGKLDEMTDEFTETESSRAFKNINHAYVLSTIASVYHKLPGLGKANQSILLGDWASWCLLGSNAQVTDERDRVYGILSLLPTFISERITPNYSKPVEDVFADLSRALVEATGSFDDILSGEIVETPGLSSWAMTLRDQSRTTVRNSRAAGYYKPHDQFARTRTWCMYWHYDIPEQWKPRFSFSEDGKVLTTKAIQVAVIDGISGSIMHHLFPARLSTLPWLEAKTPLVLHENMTERQTILKVIYSDAEFEDTPESTVFDIPWYDTFEPDPPTIEQLERNGWLPILQSDQFRMFHLFRTEKGDYKLWNGRPFREYFTTEIKACNVDAITEALAPIKSITGRTLITTEAGELGSTTVPVQQGDWIVVIPGCSYTVVVRKTEEGWFRVVGDCYIDGYMNGEVLKLVEDGKADFIDIDIR